MIWVRDRNYLMIIFCCFKLGNKGNILVTSDINIHQLCDDKIEKSFSLASLFHYDHQHSINFRLCFHHTPISSHNLPSHDQNPNSLSQSATSLSNTSSLSSYFFLIHLLTISSSSIYIILVVKVRF